MRVDSLHNLTHALGTRIIISVYRSCKLLMALISNYGSIKLHHENEWAKCEIMSKTQTLRLSYEAG